MKLFKEILFPLIAVIAAFVVGGIVVWIIGDSPIQTYKLLIGSAFSWRLWRRVQVSLATFWKSS